MIAIEDKLISDDILEKHFVCDLNACKGICCVEGEYGAPLGKDELSLLKENFSNISPFLTTEGKNAIAEQGIYVHLQKQGSFNTPLIEGKACSYVVYENGKASCGIEKAWTAGKSTFRKPISCHLYPIRIKSYKDYDAVNYEKWEICSPACSLGEKLQVPVYQFLKDALIRKYGTSFYETLEEIASAWKAK